MQGEWLSFIIGIATFLGIVVLPFAAGTFIARLLRLKEFGLKIGVILFTLVLSLTPFIYPMVRGGSWQDAIRLGIDLAGGTDLVFEVDKKGATELQKEVNAETMNQMVGAIRRRLDPANQEQITVRRVGADRIEVIIPRADSEVVENKKEIMRRLGSLEFALLANERDHPEIIREAKLVDKDLRRNGRVIASWRQVAEGQDLGSGGEIALREVKHGDKTVTEVLVIFDREDRRITGEYLTRAYQTQDPNGAPAVGFELNSRGGFLFQALTSRNKPLTDGFMRRLAILLDGNVYSAPTIRNTISDRGVIEGRFTQKEIDDLVQVLNAGALDVPIKPDPISEATTSPTLGHDVQTRGVISIFIAGLIVFVFMLAYYLFAGLVADLCLLLNLVLVMGAMAFIKAAFTLPGLAGLVLTIGMAVDANVLIFERIREEQQRGSSLRMAIHNGFARAFSTIVDANVTTLLTAVVLYAIGTDQVRGFAVTLFIGIVVSMFTALYFGRLIFDICERKRWIRSLRMMSFVGATRYDFIGKRYICYVGSAVLIVVGMTALFVRGADNLDIDFLGGTMVSFKIVKPKNVDVDSVRKLLEQKIDPNITLEKLTLADTTDLASSGTRLRLRIPRKTDETEDPTAHRVRLLINSAFGESGEYELLRVTMKFGDIVQIPAAPGDEAKKEEADSAGKTGTEPSAPAPKSKDAFAGGHEVLIDFSDEILEGTISDYLAAALSPQNVEGARSLFAIEGTKGSGIAAKEGSVRRYSQVRLRVLPDLDESKLRAALVSMQNMMASEPVLDEVSTFAAEVAREMQKDALLAMLASLVAIVAYIWFRFQRITFGLAAVAALVHDVLSVLGMVALASVVSGTAFGRALDLTDFKINLPMIAAFLTIVGYSLNDTIVVFDRIREVRGKNPDLTIDMLNISLNQTLSRTLLTSFTTLMVVIILYFFGGSGIHGFAYCLVVGVMVGTYSSIYVASPILLWLMNRTAKTRGPAGQRARVQVAAKT